jgi:hypothetical protein
LDWIGTLVEIVVGKTKERWMREEMRSGAHIYRGHEESASFGDMHVGDRVADRGDPRGVTCFSGKGQVGPTGWTRRKIRVHDGKWQEKIGGADGWCGANDMMGPAATAVFVCVCVRNWDREREQREKEVRDEIT